MPVIGILSYVSMGLSAAAFARLVQQRLFGKSPFLAFGCMLLVGIARDGILHLTPYDTHQYALAWEITLAPLLLTHVWAALATYRRLAGLYPKIGSFATWLFAACVAVAVILCCTLTPFETPRIAGNELILRTMFLLHRWVDTLCAGALLLAVLFLSRLPSPMKHPPRNVLLHTCFLSAYFGIYALTYFAENLAPLGAAVWIERAQLVMVCMLYGGWAYSLSAAGEEGESWPGIDPLLAKYIQGRYYAALSRLRWAAR
jgi:hypothetical protein